MTACGKEGPPSDRRQGSPRAALGPNTHSHQHLARTGYDVHQQGENKLVDAKRGVKYPSIALRRSGDRDGVTKPMTALSGYWSSPLTAEGESSRSCSIAASPVKALTSPSHAEDVIEEGVVLGVLD